MKKTLTDIDGASTAQREHVAKSTPRNAVDRTYGFYQKDRDSRLWMGNKLVQLGIEKNTLTVDNTVYKLTPGLIELITNKHPRPDQYNIDDEGVYRSLVEQTKVKLFPNMTAGDRPHTTRKWKYMLKKMVAPGEMLGEESRDIDDTDSVESDTASVGNIGESSGRTAPGILTFDSDILSPGSIIS